MRAFKKSISILLCFLIVILLIVPLSSCQSNNSKVKTLYVYNWGEYMSDGSYKDSLDVNAAFEEWYEREYGEKVKVNYSTYSSNEDLYAKLTSGTVSYDVIIPSDYMVQRLADKGYLRELNYDNITNIQHILPEFLGENAYYDEGNKHSVPYLYGMIGIIYNTTMVPADEENLGSWALMWDEDYAGNILQFNNSRDAFGTAMYYQEIDVNYATDAEWRLALDDSDKGLKKQKNIVQGYVMDEIFNKMENGSAAIAAYYAGDYLTMYETNNDLEFFYPEEGTNLYVDAMCVPTCSKNPEIAERYINFMLTEEAAVANAKYTYYASPNSLVVNNPDYIEYMAEIKEDAYEKMYPSDVKTSSYQQLDENKQALLNQLWEELKSDVDVGVGIYVLCGVIVGTLILMFVIFMVKKRAKRKLYENN